MKLFMEKTVISRIMFFVCASVLVSSLGVWSQGIFAEVYSIDKTQSGLVAFDPLNNETKTKQQLLANQNYWTYYGTAVSEKNTAYDVYKDSEGLHIGEPGPNPVIYGDGSYSGYYAMSPPTDAVLVHTVISATNQAVAKNDFQSQLEIMTTSGLINYIDCAAITSSGGTYWAVVHGYGDAVEAYGFDTLWFDDSLNQPLTRDCTVITNGQNYLRVYMDNVLVFSSNTLSLNMPAPFNYYFQTMNSYYNQMRYGTFRDYYATSSENISVINNPPNAATVSLVDLSGNVLARSDVVSGDAVLDVGQYHFPLDATINVYDSTGAVIASGAKSMFGGDVFTVNTTSPPPDPTVPAAPSGLSASAVSQFQIDLMWNAPNNGGSPITGYEIERSLDNGSTWSVLVSNTNSASTSYSDTGLSPSTDYAYRVFAINSVGTSLESNMASATTPSAPPPNSPPNAANDSAQTPINTSVTINVLANDSDPDGDALTVSSITIPPGHGTATINPNNTITYTPSFAYMGSDSFRYQISDGKGGTATALVSITVKLPFSPPM
ncbi:MAG: hypothetical protein EPO62_05030 [Candidatus Nitrosotenuis sp.]|nr:MAG: hypothetical protein EPO62_05030 [Candidatus Nitrosotenuis sp.]